MKLRVDICSRWLVVLAAVLFTNFAFAQRTITGTVTDAETGEALIGANVLVIGTSSGTVTDLDGNYSIDLPDGSTQLEFSYTGYTSQTVSVTASDVLDISLAAGETLDEVVVVGYGTQKEKEITSSVTSVDAKEFNQGPITDPSQLLQGKVAGLQVYNRGGDPNNGNRTIRLRGAPFTAK